MKVYETKNLRNVGIFGHAGSGKTTLVESLLFQAGNINRKGTVEDRNTVSDYSELEHERGCSIFSTPIAAEYNDLKLNIIDTPGYDDYIGEVAATIKVVDSALITINAHNGIEVGAENGWYYSELESKPTVFIINKTDTDQVDYDKLITELKDRFGHLVTAFQYPVKTGAGFDSVIDLISMTMFKYQADTNKFEKVAIPDNEKSKAESMRGALVETIAESDDELMNKYFEEGQLSEEDVNKGLRKALINRQIFPVLVASSKTNTGVNGILDFIVNVLPNPLEMPTEKTLEGNDISYDPNGKISLFVYKLLSEAHLGDMTFFRLHTGKLGTSTDLVNENKSSSERLGQIFIMAGKKRDEVPTLLAGDIAATVKLKNTHINDTMHEKGFHVSFKPIVYPKPRVRTAIVPKVKGEEEKVGMGLHGLHLEDPSLVVEHSQELRQIIVYAQGELHLSAARWRLSHRYHVESEFIEPRVPYRETIQKQVRGSYRHKKQSGGAGQFAEVHMLIEPWVEGMPDPVGIAVRGKELIPLDWGGNLEYVNSIVGGVIDQRFMPAILKGVMDKMQFGPLTGSYVRDIRVIVYDGKMHPVDSNEAAFKTAGMMVFKENFTQASPKILEPIYLVDIKVPEDFVGDVMSDLPSRRGVILGIDSEGRYQKIKARMPLAELDKYATALRSMTQARATYTSEFSEYQSVPPNVQQELIDAYKKHQTEEE
jgi:elongation factor G